jgi:MarR family 2-MHQ and catechol resistance regulon transcriptional repressor
METDKQAKGPRVWLILHKAQKTLQTKSEANIREQSWCMSDFAVLELLLHEGTLPVNTIGTGSPDQRLSQRCN